MPSRNHVACAGNSCVFFSTTFESDDCWTAFLRHGVPWRQEKGAHGSGKFCLLRSRQSDKDGDRVIGPHTAEAATDFYASNYVSTTKYNVTLSLLFVAVLIPFKNAAFDLSSSKSL